MRKRNALNRTIFKKIMALGVLLVVILILLLLKRNVAVCEWVSANFARGYIRVIGSISNVIPFSLYETAIIALVVTVFVVVVRIIKYISKGFIRSAVSLVLSISIFAVGFVSIYISTASFAYNRQSVAISMVESDDPRVNEDLLKTVAVYCADKLNQLSSQMQKDEFGVTKCPYSFNELSKLVAKEYEKLDKEYFSEFKPKAKKMLFSRVMLEMRLTGLFFAPFGEVNINSRAFVNDVPVTIAHEMAHSKGVMNEDSANLCAYYVLINSDDNYLQYCGYYSCFWKITSQLYLIEGGEEVYQQIEENMHEGYIRDSQADASYWHKYDLLASLSQKMNDFYLRASGTSGTSSYYVPPVAVDTGEQNEQGDPIYRIKSYNSVQKMIFALYLSNEL